MSGERARAPQQVAGERGLLPHQAAGEVDRRDRLVDRVGLDVLVEERRSRARRSKPSRRTALP